MSKQRTAELTNFHGIRTVSPQMLGFLDKVEKVARSEAAVLIRGETGAGKELVARAIHTLSRRAKGPFRAVNCATLTPELLASELFGHVRGAFTGAIRDRIGLFAAAHKGTLFLDEVAETPLDIQARLLRVLEEKSFVPVGGTEPVKVNVRILTATLRSLRREVRARRFRQDLMYRIRVVPLFLPRLADRQGDVEALTDHFIEELNARGERRVDAIHPDALKTLLAHDWPGNVRELRNVLEYAFVIGEGATLRLSELTPELRGEAPPGDCRYDDGDEPEALDLRELERRRIIDALEEAGGRKARAAERLGMSRTTLWRKLKEHRLVD